MHRFYISKPNLGSYCTVPEVVFSMINFIPHIQPDRDVLAIPIAIKALT